MRMIKKMTITRLFSTLGVLLMILAFGAVAASAAPSASPSGISTSESSTVSPTAVPSTQPIRAFGAPSTIQPPAPADTPTVVPAGEGGPRNAGTDPGPPTARFLEPFEGSTVSGTVKIRVQAYAPFSPTVDYVQFFVDGQSISGQITTWGNDQSGKCDVSCFFVMWDSTRAANGARAITAVANYKGQEKSITLNVNVDNSISAPVKKQSTGSTNTTRQQTSSVGTLSVSGEGDLYLAGRGYLGRNNRVIKLFPGKYTVYARAPSSGRICWSRTTTIIAGKSSLMRVSGIPCR